MASREGFLRRDSHDIEHRFESAMFLQLPRVKRFDGTGKSRA
jgi:hypothetical protein